MTGMRRQGAVDGLGVSRRSGSFHSVVARQTLAGGRVGKKFVVKAMFEVRDPNEVSRPYPRLARRPRRALETAASESNTFTMIARASGSPSGVAGARTRLRRRGIIAEKQDLAARQATGRPRRGS